MNPFAEIAREKFGRYWRRPLQRLLTLPFDLPSRPPILPPSIPKEGPITRDVILACLPVRSRSRIKAKTLDWLVAVFSNTRCEEFADDPERLRAAVLVLHQSGFTPPLPRGTPRPTKRQGRTGRRVNEPPHNATPPRIVRDDDSGPPGRFCRVAPQLPPPSSYPLWTEPKESPAPKYRPIPDVCVDDSPELRS